MNEAKRTPDDVAAEDLGAETQDERRAFAAVAGALAAAVTPQAPPPSLRSRLLDRVGGSAAQPWKGWAQGPREPMVIVRGGAGGWQESGTPGVRVKRLFVDTVADRVTMLIRMEPGTSYPRHRHGGAEECFVLEGDLSVDTERMRAGDYQRAEASSVHGVQSTENGCLLLIHSSQHDELLGA